MSGRHGDPVAEVAAAGVNRADLMQRQGLYPPPAGAPPYPGLECSGTVAALGDGVSGWHVGQQVCALLSGGGYAEQVAVPAGQLLPIPASTTLIEAAALPETACTVYSNVFLTARLAPGETLLVHGGGSGIGTMAIQLAKHAGARHVHITMTFGNGMLRTEVLDDGCGGADPGRGTGLRGVERRLGTFDGVLAISSPPGGPTIVVIEVPCELS